MSNNKDKEMKNNVKNNFSLLGKKTESPFLPDSKLDHPLDKKQCQLCNNNNNLIQCIKCYNYYCFECIKQIYHFQKKGENGYICEDCKKNEKFQKIKRNFFCFICGEVIGGKKKSCYLINKLQKLDFKNQFTKKGILIFEEEEKIINKEGFSIIRICNKCYLKYYELIEKILKSHLDIKEQKNKKQKSTSIIDEFANYILKKNYNDLNNYFTFKYANDDLDEKFDEMHKEKNKDNDNSDDSKSEINNDNDSNLYDDLNLFNFDKCLNNSSHFLNLKSTSKNINNNVNKKNLNNNLNLNKNKDIFNLKINKSIMPNINNNLNNIYDLNKQSKELNSLNSLLNLINSQNNFSLPNLDQNNGTNYLHTLNQSNNNNLDNNIVNSNEKLNNTNNLNIHLNNLNNIKEKNNDLFSDLKFENNESNNDEDIEKSKDSNDEKENNEIIENIIKESLILKEDNIYYFLYKLKDVLFQFTKYIVFFENNNYHYNKTIINNIETFSDIFERIIERLKSDIKNKLGINVLDNVDAKTLLDNKKKNKNINEKINVNDTYDYYIRYVLSVNESFKSKINALKTYSDLKNNFLSVLFKNIERLILKLSEILYDDKPADGEESQKKENKEIQSLNNQNNNSNIQLNNNPPQLNLNLMDNNRLFQNNFDNHYTPNLLDIPYYNNYNDNHPLYMPNISQILQNNNINNNLSLINNHDLNYPNIFNNNFQFDFNHQHNLFDANTLLMNNVNKAYIDKNIQNIK